MVFQPYGILAGNLIPEGIILVYFATVAVLKQLAL